MNLLVTAGAFTNFAPVIAVVVVAPAGTASFIPVEMKGAEESAAPGPDSHLSRLVPSSDSTPAFPKESALFVELRGLQAYP